MSFKLKHPLPILPTYRVSVTKPNKSVSHLTILWFQIFMFWFPCMFLQTLVVSSKPLGIKQCEFNFRVNFLFNLLLSVISEAFYFEHAERRSCLSVTLSDLTVVTEEQRQSRRRRKAAVVVAVVHLTKQTGSETALLSSVHLRDPFPASCDGPAAARVWQTFCTWNQSDVKTQQQHWLSAVCCSATLHDLTPQWLKVSPHLFVLCNRFFATYFHWPTEDLTPHSSSNCHLNVAPLRLSIKNPNPTSKNTT